MSKSRKRKTHSQKVMAKRKARRRKSRLNRQMPEMTIIATPPGEAKMSEVLEDFIAPYADLLTTRESWDKILTVALIAWNAALVTGKARKALINGPMSKLPPDKTIREDYKAIVNSLIRRKLQFFADNERHIIDYKLTDTGTGYHLSVISSFPE